MAVNPITSPRLFDTFTLDYLPCPAGKTVIKSGGNRQLEFSEQQAPLTTGAMTVLRFEKIAHVTYTAHLWLPEHFDRWDPWMAMLNAGKEKRPPRVYVCVDPRTIHNKLTLLTYEEVGPLMQPEPGKAEYTYDMQFIEWRRPKPIGGPVKPPENPLEQEILGQEMANRAMTDALKVLEAAEAAKK